MLLENKNFFIITNCETNNTSTADIRLRINPSCEVFKGHFPGFPVVPGVCSMETVKECAEKVIGHHTFMRNIIQCRFRNLIEPSKVEELTVKIDFSEIEDGKRINAVMFQDEKIFMELKAELAYA